MLSLEKKDYSLTRSHNRYTSKNIKNTNLRIKETESTFHYELKIPGYVKEDFNFYVSQDYLVVTTGRSKMNGVGNKNSKHSYCYPSAYFKINIPLPSKYIKNEILVNYKNEILSLIY